MKHPLLSIAVAEEIYGWKYAFPGSEKCYVTPSDPDPVSLPNFVSQKRSLQLLRSVLEKEPFKRAKIWTPFCEGGFWSVEFYKQDGTVLFQVMAPTMEETIVRACLMAQGVAVDDGA